MSTDTRKVGVLALAKRAGLAVGYRINVVFTASNDPMFRELAYVRVETRHGRDWLMWRWIPNGTTPWGTADCGFAGNVIDDDFIAVLESMAVAEVAA